jgi:hypothetical protein
VWNVWLEIFAPASATSVFSDRTIGFQDYFSVGRHHPCEIICGDHLKKAMRKVIAIALTLAVTILIGGAASKHDFKPGKLLDIGSTDRVVEGTVYRSALFTVQVADLVYTARGARIMRWTKDVGQGLIVGDPVQIAIDGDSLIFLKPDGKEMKTTIIKRTRSQ